MPWLAHAWMIGAWVVSIALLVVVAMSLHGGWFPFVFAIAVGLPVFLMARRLARRRYERGSH